MANITLKLNGNVVEVDEFTAGIMADIITTANPGSKTVVDAVNNAGGESYVELFSNAGDPADVFEVTVKGIENKRPVTKIGTGSRAVILARFGLALTAKTWQTDVIKVYDGESADKPATATVRKMAVI